MRHISGNNKREKRHYRQAPRDLSQCQKCSTSNQTAAPLGCLRMPEIKVATPASSLCRPTDEVVRCHLTASKLAPRPSEQAQRGQVLFIVWPQRTGHPTAERTQHRKRAYTNKFRGACTLHTTTTTTYGGREAFHRSLPFPDRGPSFVGTSSQLQGRAFAFVGSSERHHHHGLHNEYVSSVGVVFL